MPGRHRFRYGRGNCNASAPTSSRPDTDHRLEADLAGQDGAQFGAKLDDVLRPGRVEAGVVVDLATGIPREAACGKCFLVRAEKNPCAR